MQKQSGQELTSTNRYMHLPASLRRLARESGSVRMYQAGETITNSSIGGEQIRYFVSGKASIVLQDDNHEKIAVDTLSNGDLFGEVEFFTGSPWPSDAEVVADEECEILEIRPDIFEQLLSHDPAFAVPLVRNLVRKIIRLDRSLFDTKLKRRALQSLISQKEHIFPEYLMGDYVERRVKQRVDELCKSDMPVLIMGESGVGKEGLAHSLFRKSHLGKEVFLQVDLMRTSPDGTGIVSRESKPEISEEDLTDEQQHLFFGSEEPGRDGRVKETPGYFELSADGTLLVRGVDKLTRVMQLKLLEALVTQTYSRFGGVRRHKSKVRLIATTRLGPEEITPDRHPLLFALKDSSIVIPSLRKRRKEIPGLVNRYLDRYRRELGRSIEQLPEQTMKALVNYSWPGNDLELATTLKRAILVSKDGVLRPHDVYFDLKSVEGRGKYNLLSFRPIKKMFESPLFPAVLQSAATPFFFIVLAFLFLGPTDPTKNMAALFSWSLGWPILIIGTFLWARFWCTLCPIGTVSELVHKVWSLDRPFPTFLKKHSDFLIAGTVLFIIWFETATDIRSSPMSVGFLLLAMLVSAVIFSLLYERQAWCLYLCGLGGMIGVLSKTSMVELRADRNVCISNCDTNECYVGTAEREGCPYGQAGPKLHSNRMCKLCGTCAKNCPHGAISLNVRLPGKEIWEIRHTNPGTAFLVIGMMGGLLSEIVTRMPVYQTLTDLLPLPEMARFTIVFLGLLSIINLAHVIGSAVSSRIVSDSFTDNYSRYGLSFLPLALGSFMAFHVYYLVNLGVQIPILLRHNFDFAILDNLIITVPPDITYVLQMLVVIAGLIGTLVIIVRLGFDYELPRGRITAGTLPHVSMALIMAALLAYSMSVFFYGS